ncbi:MAG: hypothetical protein LQ343_004920 [Gyalolechia ehrenbergii]|nr:MAG: hypothetical protein LQ343_004920 [Gyalolechia ehrenbergii]
MSGFLEDVDAKIRLLTYLRNDLAEAFIGTDLLRKQLPLDNAASPDNLKAVASSQSEGSPPRFVKQALGSLDRLPPELLQEVLYNSDLRSLTNLRALNPETRSLIDSLPHYRTIIERVPDALRLMLSTGTARATSPQPQYRTRAASTWQLSTPNSIQHSRLIWIRSSAMQEA